MKTTKADTKKSLPKQTPPTAKKASWGEAHRAKAKGK